MLNDFLLPISCTTVLLGSLHFSDIQPRQSALASHPVKAVYGKPGKVPVEVKGEKFYYTWNGTEAGLERADTLPKYPLVLLAFKSFYLKVTKDSPWVSIKRMSDQGPPKPPVPPKILGDGDDMDHGPFPPFKVGDKVVSLAHPELRIGEVTSVEWVHANDGVQFWGINVKFKTDYGFTIHSGRASLFVKADWFPETEESILPPFLEGDLVKSKLHPEYGIMTVVEVKKLVGASVGSFFWGVHTSHKVTDLDFTHNYFAKSTDLILVRRGKH